MQKTEVKRELVNGVHATTDGFSTFIYLDSFDGPAMLECKEAQKMSKYFTFLREKNKGGKKDRARNIELFIENVLEDKICSYEEDIDSQCRHIGIDDYHDITYDDSSSGREIINFLSGYKEALEFVLETIRKVG
jgi:hypothetical protein